MLFCLTVECGEGFFVVLVKALEDLEVAVVDRFVGRVRLVGLAGRDEVLDLVDGTDDAEANTHDGGGSDGTDVLRRVDRLYLPAGDICKDLAGDRRQGSPADEADGIGRLDVFRFLFEHPALVVADAFDDRADHFAFAGLQRDVEEHARRVRVFEGTAVTVEPGREDDTVGTGRYGPHDLGQVVVKGRVGGLEALTVLRDIVLVKVDVHFIESQVVLDPLDTLGGGLHLGKVVVTAFLSTDDGGDHGHDVDLLFFQNGADPAGRTGIDVCIAREDRACAHRDEGRVSATAEDGNAGHETEVFRRFRGQGTDFVRGLADVGQMLFVDAHHVTDLVAPALVALAGVIEQCCEGRVFGHDTLAGAAADEVFLNIEPFVDLVVDFRLVVLDPEVFEDGVLDRGGHRVGVVEVRQELEQVGAGDLRTVGDGLLQFLFGALVHVGHGGPEGVALFVDDHDTLHLAAEGDAVDLLRFDVRLREDLLRGDAHRLPPVVDVLLDAAVFENGKTVTHGGGLQQSDDLVDAEETGLDAGGADVIGHYVFFHVDYSLFSLISLVFSHRCGRT